MAKTIQIEVAGAKKQVPTKFKAKVKRSELTPMLGWQWILGPGFTVGLDLGWQVATSSSSDLTIETEGLTDAERALLEAQPEYKSNEKKVRDDFLDKYQGKGLPHAALGLGWMI